MKSISDEFATLTLGAAAHFESLTIFPLLRDCAAADPGYTLLDDAIARGSARLTELGAGGSVPQLRFENAGEQPVLLLDGEELAGAKQNRTINLTVLAPAKQTIVIPVSCVEAGRWAAQSVDFTPAPHVMYARVRAARAEQVTASMAATGSRQSNQSAVWADLAEKANRVHVASPTAAMGAMFERHAASIDAYLHAFSWMHGQAGLLFAIGRETMGLDLFDHPQTLLRLFPKLLRSYALDAIESPNGGTTHEEASSFLARIAGLPPMSSPAVGLGKDVRLTGAGASGAALWANDRYIHLCAFSSGHGGGAGTYRSLMSRPSRRRNPK